MLLHRAQASQPLAGNAGPGGEETPSPHVLATRLHLDRQPLCPSLPSSPHMLTCQRNSFTAVAPRPPKLVTDKAPSQTHRPPRCPPGTGLAGPLCLGQTPGSLRARAKRGARLAPRPRAPRQHRDSGAGSCVGRVLVPETQPYLAQGHLSLQTGAPRAAGAGHAAHPRRPLRPFSHCLLLFWPQAARAASLRGALLPAPQRRPAPRRPVHLPEAWLPSRLPGP